MGQLHATTYVATKGAHHRLHQGAGRRRGRARRARELDLARQHLYAAVAGGDRRRSRSGATAAPTARPRSSWAAWAPSRRRAGSACSWPRRPPSPRASITSSPAARSSVTGGRRESHPDQSIPAPLAPPRRFVRPEGSIPGSDKNVGCSRQRAQRPRSTPPSFPSSQLADPKAYEIVAIRLRYRFCRFGAL